MPPVRTPGGRASKACEGCRRGKTRCYPSSSGSCLRCNTLRLKCSLQDEPANITILPERFAPTSVPNVLHHDCSAVEERVALLERTVLRIAEAVGLDAENQIDLRPEKSTQNAPTAEQSSTASEAPLLVIRNAVAEVDINLSATSTPETIVDKGYLSVDEVKYLLSLFRQHYRRWIALRENDHLGPDLQISNSPLLLCACCLIAIRHWNSDRARETVDLLYHEAKSLLSQHLLQAPQPLAFFQAVLILSFWSTTVGQRPLSMDAWLISGYAIQQGSASEVFRETNFSSSLDSEYGSTIGKLLLWNRLCLAHLHACISMRRTAMVTRADIERIRKKLPPGELSNYEMRMVAELNLYWTLYENAVATAVNLPQAQAALQSWKHVWAFLFDQPRPQFIQMGFHFAQLLVFEQSLNNKSAAVRESLLTEMVRLCSAILQLAMETTDDRTKHLTDHIYHMITFAAVTLCRLLCKYEPQLQMRMNVAESDLLILSTVRWLHTLGSPLHVGHTMGNLIDAVHRKLRPEVNMAYRRASEPEQPTPEQSTFPGLLGMSMDGLDFDWDSMIPDWQSLASDEMAQYNVPPR